MVNPTEPCQVCGDVGVKDYIMTCYNCRTVREHIYCASICLRSVPNMWLCQVCRSPPCVLQVSDLKDNLSGNAEEENPTPVLQSSTSNGLMLLSHSCPDKASLVSSDILSIRKHRPRVLGFPFPKRKRTTLRLAEEDIERTKRFD
ncbi:uncharacterized protein LOC111830202 [Capsella rubella]|uniref:uncharacterized protein LOC111830202 n=1 Tax=Capsella rubella TaxID=81985 RepID=UPI000CD4ACE5|nr:uncharacterized protein LOC111830202 [Capsella rubella]